MWDTVGNWFGSAWDWGSGVASGAFDTATGLLTGVADINQEISSRVGEALEDIAGSTAETQRQQRITAQNILGMSTPSLVLVAALILTLIVVVVGR